MKILILSDTHRSLSNASDIIRRLRGKIDFVFHLGDHDSDAENLSYEFEYVPFEYISGNCDWGAHHPREKELMILGKKIFLCHGHNHGVKRGVNALEKLMMDKGYDIILFGHTHIPYLGKTGDKLIMNPGSIAKPRSEEGETYGIIEITQQGKIEGNIVKYQKRIN